jgi:hypothetical protein
MARKRQDDSEGAKPPDNEEKPPRRRKRARLGNPDADPVRIHREYVERRVGGGTEPTKEAYARALEQWRQLPGAVSTPPAELTGEDAAPSAEPDVEPEETEAESEGGGEEQQA